MSTQESSLKAFEEYKSDKNQKDEISNHRIFKIEEAH